MKLIPAPGCPPAVWLEAQDLCGQVVDPLAAVERMWHI